MISIILLCAALALAYRGKGGLFTTLGIIPANFPGRLQLSHLLGAIIAGLAIALLLGVPNWTPLFIGLWYNFTIWTPAWCLDLCSGFTLLKFLKATLRQCLIIPVALATYYFGNGNLWFSLGILLLGSLYWIGGIVNRRFPSIDPVAVAEWSTSLAGIIIYGVGK